MLELWKIIYPDSNITQQLTDQRKFIVRNKIFKDEKSEEIQMNCENGKPQNNSGHGGSSGYLHTACHSKKSWLVFTKYVNSQNLCQLQKATLFGSSHIQVVLDFQSFVQ